MVGQQVLTQGFLYAFLGFDLAVGGMVIAGTGCTLRNLLRCNGLRKLRVRAKRGSYGVLRGRAADQASDGRRRAGFPGGGQLWESATGKNVSCRREKELVHPTIMVLFLMHAEQFRHAFVDPPCAGAVGGCSAISRFLVGATPKG